MKFVEIVFEQKSFKIITEIVFRDIQNFKKLNKIFPSTKL